ncbi:urea ABC transporter permease subunit UrtB [Telmatospirillum siberiense]|uniref:urea ABC transporter permease subunit UrtB n=1 Tax=Telmatospirillum siberiense TaxID=382514 RepID=UPI001F53304B|nr:urea ABC transporter permease subunit UrtB [Telmatospirillum siberiense]
MKIISVAFFLFLVATAWNNPAGAGDRPDFAGAVAALNSDDFDEKIKAVETLAALGDPRAVPVLQALLDSRLSAAEDGRLLYADGDVYRDAMDGQPVTGVDPADLSDVSANNRVRGAIEGAIGQLSLFDPNPEKRRGAARAVADSKSAEAVDLLQRALAQETDPATGSVMTTALAGLQLRDADRTVRLTAIHTLASSTDPTMLGLLERLQDGERDQAVRRAADQAISGIRQRIALIGIGAHLFEGFSLGSVLLLAAIGLAITFGVMGVVNMAHGEMIMLGAYATYVVQQCFRMWLPASAFDAYLVVAVPVAFLISGAVGIALERGVIRFLYGRPLETLLSTWGISLVLQQLVRTIFGAPNKEVANPAWMTGGIDMSGGFILTWNRLIIIVFCLVVLGALAALLRYSRFGLQMRAVAQNRPMAAAMGIRTGRVDALTFGLGSGIAGIAGVALSQIGNVSPNLGQGYIVDSFMVVVFGGVGSLWGTLLGAVSLGVVNKFLEPYAGAMLGKILVLVFIILFIQKRPRGLFALKGRSIEG